MEEALDVDGLIDALIDREGGYVNHPECPASPLPPEALLKRPVKIDLLNPTR